MDGRLSHGLRDGLILLAGKRGAKTSPRPALPLPDRSRRMLIVGRGSDCDVVLSDLAVSRVHAILMLYGGRWLILDRKSTNGTRVNGRRIWGTTVVEPGDRVAFGPLTFHLVRHTAVAADLPHH